MLPNTIAANALGFEFDEMTEQDVHGLLYSPSADRSEVAGENGIYLDDELYRAGATDCLVVLWTFKGSVLLRHRPTGATVITTTEALTAAGWEA